MIKIAKTIVDHISNFLSSARSGDMSLASQIPQWLAAGDQLVVDGQDLLRIGADGVIQRIDGFFNEDGTPAVADLPQDVLALPSGAKADPFAQGVQFAQAEIEGDQPADTQTDSGEPTPAPAVFDAPIAVVAQASGQVEVLRNGQARMLLPGDNLYLGDIITTQDQSTVKLNFFSLQNATQAASTTDIGAGTRVSLSGESFTRDGVQTMRVSLVVDKGTVDVSQGSTADIDVRVQTPQGRVTVPQEGLTVTVQEETGQTLVSQPNAPQGSLAPPTLLSFVNTNGQESLITVGASPAAVAVGQALAPAQATTVSPTAPVPQAGAAPSVDVPANTQTGPALAAVAPVTAQEEGPGADAEQEQPASAPTLEPSQAQTPEAAEAAEPQPTATAVPQPLVANSGTPSTPPPATSPTTATTVTPAATGVIDAPAPAPAPTLTPLQASLQAALQARAAAPLTLTDTTLSSPVTAAQQTVRCLIWARARPSPGRKPPMQSRLQTTPILVRPIPLRQHLRHPHPAHLALPCCRPACLGLLRNSHLPSFLTSP